MPYPDTLAGWRRVAPPPQATRVFYSYRIMVPALGQDGSTMKVVGTFQTFNPSSTRQVQRVRGIANNGGYPLELVPGPADTSINVSYMSLYLLPLNAALGYHIGSIVDLNVQRVGFDIQEICVFPNDYSHEVKYLGAKGAASDPFANAKQSQAIETNHYRLCYLSQVGRTINQGTITIAETATIQVSAIVPTRFPNAAGYGTPEYSGPDVFPGGALPTG